MIGKCDKCGKHTFECTCRSLSACQRNDRQRTYSNINYHILPLEDCLDPPGEMIPVRWVNVCGRKEHEALIKDSAKCKELGLCQEYETLLYLKRWGGWLS